MKARQSSVANVDRFWNSREDVDATCDLSPRRRHRSVFRILDCGRRRSAVKAGDMSAADKAGAVPVLDLA